MHVQDQYGEKESSNNDYEPASELEIVQQDEDNDLTPKKKEKKAVETYQVMNTKPKAQSLQLPGSESDLTDLDLHAPTPKKNGGLRRSYAIADLAVHVQDQYEGKESGNDDYEPASELDIVQQDEDDDLTPKKKGKPGKVPVRVAVVANRKEPETHREQGKVSTTVSTFAGDGRNTC